jgi:hypothetical protein
VKTLGQTTPGLYTAVAGGSSTIKASRSLNAQGVHYSICGGCPGLQPMSGQATANNKIPGWVAVVPAGLTSDRPLCSPPNAPPKYICRTKIQYQVLDNTPSRTPIAVVLMSVTESNTSTHAGCNIGAPPNGSWNTNGNGWFVGLDYYAVCSTLYNNGTSCSEEWNQSFKVNNNTVGVVDFLGNTGTHNHITASCGSCPTVYAAQ